MKMHSVSSSNIRRAGHDGTDLYLEFMNGSVYRYDGVTPELFQSLLDADSVGKFFHQFIRSQYPATLVSSTLV